MHHSGALMVSGRISSIVLSLNIYHSFLRMIVGGLSIHACSVVVPWSSFVCSGVVPSSGGWVAIWTCTTATSSSAHHGSVSPCVVLSVATSVSSAASHHVSLNWATLEVTTASTSSGSWWSTPEASLCIWMTLIISVAWPTTSG